MPTSRRFLAGAISLAGGHWVWARRSRSHAAPAGRPGGAWLLLHLLHGLLHGLVEVLGVNAEVLGGLLLVPGHGLLDGILDLVFTNDDEARLAGVDEITEFFGARP